MDEKYDRFDDKPLPSPPGLYRFQEKWGSYLPETLIPEHIKVVIWPEDLLERQLFVYAGKFKRIPEYAELADRTVDGVVMKVCPWLDVPLRCITVKVDTINGNIYMEESVFNGQWSFIRHNIQKVINRARAQNLSCGIEEAEELVNLDRLIQEHKMPYLVKDRIRYQVRVCPGELRRLYGRRQSLLDNPKMWVFYAAKGEIYHDRSCREIRKIPLSEFTASEKIPEDKQVCTQCARTLFLRKGCAPNTKQIPICDFIFRKYGIKTFQLGRLVEAGLRFHADDVTEIRLHFSEDSWIIREMVNGSLQLLHNNYIRTGEKERWITDGFHSQKMEGRKFIEMLHCIESYSWEGHLKNQPVGWEEEGEWT